MTCRQRTSFRIGFVAILAISTMQRAHAEHKGPLNDEPGAASTAAQVLRQQATVEYKLRNFKAALKAFREALRLEPRAKTMLNIAQCHRQLGDDESALFYYRFYLRQWPQEHASPPPFGDEVRQRIQQLTRKVREEKARRRAAATGQGTRAAVRTKTAPADALTPRATQAPPVKAAPFYKRWWFWTVVGAVVAGAVTATALATTGGSDWRPAGPDLTSRFK